jgi:hypothetical protein
MMMLVGTTTVVTARMTRVVMTSTAKTVVGIWPGTAGSSDGLGGAGWRPTRVSRSWAAAKPTRHIL